MPYDLKGRNVLVTGGSRGLGALVAEKFSQQGANVAVNYVSNGKRAEEVVQRVKGNGVKGLSLQGDMGVKTDITRVVKQAKESLGGLDVVISNAGWTRFSDFADLNAMSEEEWDKCWSTNVKGNLFLLQEAESTFKANPDGGVFLITSSVAGVSTGGSSMAYSVTKAAGLHLMKCLAQTQGPKIRVNAILPGLLLTEWGMQFSEERLAGIRDKAVLKSETNLDDCAEAFITVAKNSSMTGQKIQVDAGLYVTAF